MKTKLKSTFKETPDRFHYIVQNSIDEAMTAPQHKKYRISRPLKILIAAILIIAIIPSAIFGASKLYGLLTEPIGSLGMKLSLAPKTTDDYPEYVKLIVDPPEEFETRPNLGEEKYCRVGEDPVSGFSMSLFRLNPGDDASVLEKDIEKITETVMNGHPVYLVTPVEGYGGWDRLFLYFEDVNVTVLLYYHDVTQDELETFVDGLSFVEGTEDDHTFVGTVEPASSGGDIIYDFIEIFKALPQDTAVRYSDYIGENQKEISYTSQITDIRFTENIAELDQDDINNLYRYDEIADENGNLLPKATKIIQEGDGINTPCATILRTEESEQMMVLADITYTNESDEDILAYVDYWLNTLSQNSDGSFSHAETIDKEQRIYADEYCDSERTYQSEHSDNIKQFYSFPLAANETKTVTIGFRCNKDKLDNAYLVLYADGSGITNVDTAEDISGANRYVFKVK